MNESQREMLDSDETKDHLNVISSQEYVDRFEEVPFNVVGQCDKEGKSVGIHLEPGPDGGLVMLDDTTVLDRALKILDELNMSMQKEQATESVQV